MSKRDQWLEPRAYRRLMRKEYRRERLLAQFIQRLVGIVVLFVAVVALLTLHPHFWGQP
ncbi:hypothetical protein BH23PLA1_BH23PLA1_40090 [soil metagenome]